MEKNKIFKEFLIGLLILSFSYSVAALVVSIETVDSFNSPERVFRSGGDVYFRTVIWNTGTSMVSGNLDIQIRNDDTTLVVENLPPVYVSVAPNERKEIKSVWNSSKDAEWKSASGFSFIGARFKATAQFSSSSSAFKFYVDEFGIPKDSRTLTYYSELYWWEDTFNRIKTRINNGENVNSAWTDEWTKTIKYAKSIGTNVFWIGGEWYSYGNDEGCTDKCACPLNLKGVGYWFPGSEDGNSYYSTPPMSSSVKRGNFYDLGVYDIQVARAKIREISNIAHDQGMKVAVYLDPIGLYDPIHNFGCDLNPNLKLYTAGWAERDSSNNVKRLNFPETFFEGVPLLGNPANYAVTASSYGNSPTGSADEHSGFSPSIIDSDLSKGENWDDVSYHYHIAKQFRWLVKNYDFDIFFVDDSGRLIMNSPGGITPLKFGSDEKCITALSKLEYPRDTPYGIYNSSESQLLKQKLGSSDDDDFTLDAYANMLRHMRWQLKDIGNEKALFSSDYFVPWPSLVASEDASSTDQFASDIGELERGCHILWSEQTYDMGFKSLRPAHYRDPVNKVPPVISLVQRDPRVVIGWTWANRGIALFDYDKFSPYETNPDGVVTDLKNYLTMYNSHPEIFADPNLNLDSIGRNSMWLWDLIGNNRTYRDYPSIYPSATFNLEKQIIQRYKESHPQIYAASTDEEVKEGIIKKLNRERKKIAKSNLPPDNKSLIELIREDMYNRYSEVYRDPNIKIDRIATADNNIMIGVGVLVYSSPQRPEGKRIVIHSIQQDLLGSALGDFYLVPIIVKIPENTQTNQIRIKLLTGDVYKGEIEKDITRSDLWYRSDSKGNFDPNGDYISIKIPTKVYSVVVIDIEEIENCGKLITCTECYENRICDCGYCNEAKELTPERITECNYLDVIDDEHALYRVDVGNESMAIYLNASSLVDYDSYIAKDSCSGKVICSYLSGISSEPCSLRKPGRYYIEIAKYEGSNEPYQLYFGVDLDKDGIPDFIDDRVGGCSLADTNRDNIVDDFEILGYIDLWAHGSVGDFDLLDAIEDWAHGCSAPIKEPNSPTASAVRTMPSDVVAGSTVTVTLNLGITEAENLSAIIVKEQIPPNWTVIESSPSVNLSESGMIKWIFRDNEIFNRTLRYTVEVPTDENCNTAKFRGETLYKYLNVDFATPTRGNSSLSCIVSSANLSNSIEAHSTKSTDFDLRSFQELQNLSSGMHLHSANSTVFKLATFFQINNISKSIQNHSANSSNLHIRIFENKPELWSSGRNHIKNSSSYSLRIFEKRSNLSLSTDPHNEKSSLYRLKTFNHIAELNWTRLKNAENSSEYRLKTFRRLSELNASVSENQEDSSRFRLGTFKKLSDLSLSAKVKLSNSSMQLIHTDKAFPCSSLNFGIIDSDTELIANLKSDGNCLTIISNNIILNCNNKTISGNRTNYGIYLNNRENVTIKNCNILDYEYGIYLKDSSKNRIMDNTVYSNMQYDIYLNNSDLNSVINNSACFIYGNKSLNNISNNTCEISLQFENIPENISVKREFQSIRIQVKNSGRYKVSFITGKIENISEPSSFIGPGEPVNPIFLNPGEARNLTIGLTLSDAKELRYSPRIQLYFKDILMSEAGLNLLLPSWENYKINISQSLWNISLPVKNNTKINNSRIRISQVQEYNSSEICMNSKQRVDITNTGPEPISDLSVETSGDMEFFLTPKISRFKLNPGQSTEFIIYAIINESTGDSNGSIKISGANFTEEIPVFYNKPDISGYWKPAPEFPTDSYLTASVNSFICINNPRYCVNLNIPKDIGMDKIKESSLVMNFEDRCGSAQAHDTYIYLNGNLIESLNSTITIGQFEFPFNKNLLNYSNELCVNTLNYVGSGHFCANTGNTLKLKVSNYRMYCTDLVCIKTENFETNFTDNKDNDCDGFIDWNDLDSCNFGNNNTILCPPKENCTDGIDNDGNGLTDWDDTTICIASCNDTYRNGNETGIDCGGNCAPCKPDLAIDKIGISGNLTEGELITVNSTILNLNAGDADNAIFRLIAGNFTTNKIFSISGNSNKNMNFNLILNPEMKNLIISLDPENQIRESNETNNNATLSLTITQKLPDLTVSEISFSQENTSKINITAVIKNLGDKDSGLFYVEFLIDNRSEFTQFISNLTPDKNITIIHRTIINPGNHTITVIADPDNKVKESNEFNNELSKFLFIQYPDLTIISLIYTPLNLSEVNFTATVMNLGETTRDFFLTMFYVNDTVLDILGIATQGLASGEKVNITQNWIPRTGVWVIKAVTDWNNMIPESNENNNQLTKQIIISGPCKKSTKISGTIIENEKPLPNAYIDAYLNSVIIGSDKTNPQGKYSLNLDKEKLPAIGSVEVELYPYEITIPISCGEDKKDVDIILSDLGDKEKPVIYTSTNNGKPERVFKSGDKVYITVILKNPTQEKISERLEISITDESGNEIEEIMSKNINLKPNEIKTIDEHWKSRDFAKQNLSGFEFTGRKFFVNVEFGNSIQQYGFYVDEFGVPEWLRNNVELHLGDEFRDVIDRANSKDDVINYYKNMTDYANSTGFTSLLFHHYYSYGWYESHQPSSVQYWFPAGASPDTHYSTPYSNLIKLTGSEEDAQLLIKQLVDIAHSKGLKIIAYIDPMAIYDPKPEIYALDLANQVTTGYPAAVAHHDSTSEGYAAMDENGNPRRAEFLESQFISLLNIPIKIPQEIINRIVSNVNLFAYQISPCGPARYGLANNENAFSPEIVWSDFNSWTSDPSHHYQTVRQVNWLIRNYDFDGISTDDTGRLIMGFGSAPYADDIWSDYMHPEKPTNSLYNISEDKYCKELRDDKDKDYFAMDSFANMIKHMRLQIKDNNPKKILISNDYFVPSDVDWESIISSEDMSASDQFNIVKPSFARWAYLTYSDGYKTLRNDMRRTLLGIPWEFRIAGVPIRFDDPINPKASKDRPDMVRGVLLAISWANKVHTEIILDELKKAERLIRSYVDMRRTVKLPVYSEMSQELIYHSNLKEPSGFLSGLELEQTGSEKAYAVLYRIPSDYGEKARILHVINYKVISDVDNKTIPTDYSFRIRIPSLEEVQGVYLVSADIDPKNRSKTLYPNYVYNITSDSSYWYTKNNYLYLKLPQVITSTIAYIEFKPENRIGKSYGTQSIIDKNGKIQKLQSLSLKPVKEKETINQNLEVSSEANYLSLSLGWGGSDLDMHLYSPSGQHVGYNYTSNSTDLIANTTYTSTNTSESISIQNPESGNWTIQIYGKNVSQQYNKSGEPYSLGINLQGNYKPNLTAGISAKTVTLNESASLPVSMRNIGSATAYNLSALFYSNSFNITENITLQSLESDVTLNTEINALPLAEGNATVYLSLTYSDSEGNRYNLSNSTIMQITTNPRLYIYLDYSPVNPTTSDILKFNISLLNIGSNTAYRINLTSQLDSGINAITPTNLTLTNLSAGQSAGFSFNATASVGRFYATAYAYYESQNGTLFLAGSNEVEIRVSETTTTTTLPSPPTTVPPEQPPEATTTTTTTTLPSTIPTTSTTTTTSTIQTTLTSTTITTTTTQIMPITSTTTTSTLPTTTQTTTTSTTSTTTTLPDILPPEILKSVSKIDGRKAILQLLTDEVSICKYDTKNIAYEEMQNFFTETNSTVHNEILRLRKGSYIFYARCMDRFGNVDNSSVVFRFTINATTPEGVTAQLPASKEIILCKNDGIKNYAEEGVDCGGPCKPCETTTTVRTTTTTVKGTVTTTSTVVTTTQTLMTTTTLSKAPSIIGRVIALTGKRGSEIVLFALIFTLTAMLIYYLKKGGKKG